MYIVCKRVWIEFFGCNSFVSECIFFWRIIQIYIDTQNNQLFQKWSFIQLSQFQIDDASIQQDFTGIVAPPGVTREIMQEAETVGIDLAAKMVNDEEAEKILNIAKSQTDAAIEAEKQRKALLVSWNFTELCWILQPVGTNAPLSIDKYS